MIKAVIFDFDGLILDTETLWYESYKEVLLEHEVDLPLPIFAKIIGTDNDIFLNYLQERLQEGVSVEEINERASSLQREKLPSIDLREGVEQFLIEAKELGLKIGLATSSTREWVLPFLEKYKLKDYFQVIKTRDDVTNVKPDPELYLATLEALNIKPDEAIVFEDSLNGSQAAIRAGIPCVIVPNPVTKDLDFTDYALKIESMGNHTLTEIIEEIDGKAGGRD